MQPIKTILVPTDFSAPAERAARLCAKSRRCLRGVSAPAPRHRGSLRGGRLHGYGRRAARGIFRRPRPAVAARLAALLTPDEKKTYSAVIATRMGYAATEILDYVRDHGAIDLIVIATAGRGAVSRLMMGSVTDKIVRTAPCPVLTVHPHDRKGVAEAPQAA